MLALGRIQPEDRKVHVIIVSKRAKGLFSHQRPGMYRKLLTWELLRLNQAATHCPLTLQTAWLLLGFVERLDVGKSPVNVLSRSFWTKGKHNTQVNLDV